MGSACSCLKKEKKPLYRNGRPLQSGGVVTACFPDGQLYRIVKKDKWYYYNDTKQSMAHVQVSFGAGSTITVCGQTVLQKSNENGACTASVGIYPLDTVMFVSVKTATDIHTEMHLKPFTDAEKEQLRQRARLKVRNELTEMEKLASQKKTCNAHQLLALARRQGKKFVDLEFPPLEESLVYKGTSGSTETLAASLRSYYWNRPVDFLPRTWHSHIKLFHNISARDIEQGELGDCYFLCACSALANYPKNIEGIFKSHHFCCITRSERACGGWRVTLNIHGWWRNIIVDDYLPSSQLLPSFARSHKDPGEQWVSLLEKAYAKAYGSYLGIAAGFPWQALQDLTGYPSYSFEKMWRQAEASESGRKKLFTSLAQWISDDHLVAISTPSTSKLSANVKKTFDSAGLALGHAYTVLDAKHFPLHGLCLLKIRNPWANSVEWTGDWSDDSPLWETNKLIRAICNPKKRADGVFWMEWKDVVKYFNNGCVCYKHGHWYSVWHDYRVAGVFDGTYPDIALEIIVRKKSCKAYFTLQQKDRRGLPSSDQDAQYTPLMLSVCEGQLSDTAVTVVANSSDNAEEPTADFVFCATRSVSVCWKLEKDRRYYIVPRRQMTSVHNTGAAQMKKYVMAMACSRRAAKKTLEVSIVRLDRNNVAFRNYKTFDIGTVRNVDAIFQVRHENKQFVTKQGSTFTQGKKVDSNMYVQM